MLKNPSRKVFFDSTFTDFQICHFRKQCVSKIEHPVRFRHFCHLPHQSCVRGKIMKNYEKIADFCANLKINFQIN